MKQETITGITTKYKGMGSFLLMPQEGKTYYAKLDNYPNFTYKFENTQTNGVALHYEPKGNNLVFTLSRNIKETGTENLAMVVWHKNQEVFTEEVEMEDFQYPVEIYKGFFPEGISKITITDAQNNILAERLIFVRNENEKTLEITTDKQEYGTREQATLNITSLLDENDTIQNTLSVAIVCEDYFSEGGNSQSIESYLLLDSELKGPIESPASYFTDEEEITATEKLDLVMQVNGWRRYYWDELNRYDWQSLPNWDDAGLTVQGKVTTLFGGKPVEDGIVKMGPFSSMFTILRDTTDEAGNYQFNRLFLKDSAVIMINAENSRGNSSVEIADETPAVFDSIIPVALLNNTNYNISIPEKFYRASFYRHLAEKKYELEHGSILIKDVEVLGQGPKSDGHFRIYGEPDKSFQITEDDWSYISIYDYLEFKGIAGLIVDGENVYIRGAKALFVVDGIPQKYRTDQDYIKYFPIQDIDKIELLYSAFSAAVFQTEAAISILTRTGQGAFDNEFERIIHGRITPKYRGFRRPNEFYVPKYPLAESDTVAKRPDQRPTLYWNPYAILNKGKTELEFSTSDMLGNYRVIVEGISERGKICYAASQLEVTVLDK